MTNLTAIFKVIHIKLDSKRCFNDAYLLFKKDNLVIAYHMPMTVLKTIRNTEKIYDRLPALKKHTFIEEPLNK